jgi:hypothetical protein
MAGFVERAEPPTASLGRRLIPRCPGQTPADTTAPDIVGAGPDASG